MKARSDGFDFREYKPTEAISRKSKLGARKQKQVQKERVSKVQVTQQTRS